MSEELQHEKRDSIILKRNAKGEYAWDIKLYFDAEGKRGSECALANLSDIDISLQGAYL